MNLEHSPFCNWQLNLCRSFLIPAFDLSSSSLRRNPFIGCATIELRFNFEIAAIKPKLNNVDDLFQSFEL